MSRCYACNVVLKPVELVRRFKDSGNFTDMCTKCLKDVNVETVEGRAYKEEDTEIDIEDVSVFDEGDNDTDEVEDWE